MYLMHQVTSLATFINVAKDGMLSLGTYIIALPTFQLDSFSVYFDKIDKAFLVFLLSLRWNRLLRKFG
jgi:hypothetical protein